jgi:hypothetical protein
VTVHRITGIGPRLGCDFQLKSGDAQGALQLFRELLPDTVRVLGPDHPDVMTIRSNIARCTAESDSNEEHKSAPDTEELLPLSKISGS